MKAILIDENLGKQSNLSPFIKAPHLFPKKDKDATCAIFTDNMCFHNKMRSCNLKRYAWLIEPPIVNGEMYINFHKVAKNFEKVFSHNKWLEKRIDNFHFMPHGGTWLREEDIKIHNKNKLCSIIMSNKEWNAGHRHRISIWNRLNKSNIDCFGSICRNKVEYKVTALQDYMFSIAMENESVPFLFDREVHYFSEKLIDCLLTGTIPLYLGNPHIINNYFNRDGIMCFTDYESLAKQMEKITPELYQSKQKAIEENFNLAHKYIHPEELIYEELCKS